MQSNKNSYAKLIVYDSIVESKQIFVIKFQENTEINISDLL